VVHQLRKKKDYLLLVDLQGNILSEFETAELNVKGGHRRYLNAIIVNNRLLVKTVEIGKGDRKDKVFTDEFSTSSLSFIKNRHSKSAPDLRIGFIEPKIAKRTSPYSLWNHGMVSSSSLVASTNGKYVLEYSVLTNEKTYDTYVQFSILDTMMEEIGKGKFKFHGKHDYKFIQDIQISNMGEIYMLTKEFPDEPRNYSGYNLDPNYTFHLLTIGEDRTKIQDQVIKFDKYFVTNALLKVTNEGLATVTGIFAYAGYFGKRCFL
jgi:hypothetical protein